MDWDAQQLAQLATLLAQQGQAGATYNPGQSAWLQSLIGSGQSAVQAEAQKKAQKEAEKKKSSGLGQIAGALLGSVVPGVGTAAGMLAGAGIGEGVEQLARGNTSQGVSNIARGAMSGYLMNDTGKGGKGPSIMPPSGVSGQNMPAPRTPNPIGGLSPREVRQQYRSNPASASAMNTGMADYLRSGGELTKRQIRRMPRGMEEHLTEEGFTVNRGNRLRNALSTPMLMYLMGQF